MKTLYTTPFGQFSLQRIPDKDKNLQAWNSADLYLLNYLFEKIQSTQIPSLKLDLKKANILILNDAFGALTLPMAQFGCDSYSDSYISHKAMQKNINENDLPERARVNFLKSTDKLEKTYDLVLFKNVKTHALLKDEMLKVAQHIHENTLLLGASMAKNLQKSTLEMLNHTIGQAHASLTWKKARLIHTQSNSAVSELQTDPQTDIQQQVCYHLDGSKEVIYNLANVFSRNKLDIGARFFLEHFPSHKDFSSKPCEKIVDLGCGNGVLALKAAQKFPDASITCIDESYMAVASAKLTLKANLKNKSITFIVENGLSNFKQNSVDLILCNPPFHQQYAIGDAIARQMFNQSKKTLVKGGELWIVGNRHLDYHNKLKKIFGNQTVIAANKKFVILKAVKY